MMELKRLKKSKKTYFDFIEQFFFISQKLFLKNYIHTLYQLSKNQFALCEYKEGVNARFRFKEGRFD